MTVPGYTEFRELGHGATGRVMLAIRDSDRRPVAVKHLSARLREDPGFAGRFRAEAPLIRQLGGPHLARLLDYVEGRDDAATVAELVDGVTLRRLIEHDGATGPEAALAVLKGALLALAEGHRLGVAHRDVKPENVIVCRNGDSRLVDFGLAAPVRGRAPLAGTPSHLAPERWDGAPAGPGADIYAAAVAFFECLTGCPPFTAGDVAGLARLHRHASPPLDDVEEPLRALAAYGLAKDPAERPESAEAFLAVLEKAARAGYGPEWEAGGRANLALLAVPHLARFPLARPAS
ncbi:serine/threonine-protein kinase, partial [Nonomuraea lactucae]|uniref:serine/threonine-protein kinase n=1 Tax=Nonomuraea lactucae TaxID=2249762 RepID=UPI0013B41605